MSGGGNADSDALALALAVNVGTGLFERSAVAIVVEGRKVREGERVLCQIPATEAEVTWREITVGDRHVYKTRHYSRACIYAHWQQHTFTHHCAIWQYGLHGTDN